MGQGLKPRTITQIFAPVPAARSRCLSTFVAIARQDLPVTLRYEASHILALAGVGCLALGFFTEPLMRYGGTLILVGWGTLILAFLATLGQDRLVYGKTRSRLIRQLDEVRRNTGLDQAILPESLEFLEAAAQQWERIEHALQAQAWRNQHELRRRIDLAAHGAMEQIVVLECGSVEESGYASPEAEVVLLESAKNLAWLADQVDSTGAALMTYPREAFESNGMAPNGVVPELEKLEEALGRLGQAREPFTTVP